MKTVKAMIAMTFAAVATSTILPALGGDSSPFLLDTADGTRIATEGEAIPVAYSPRWGNAASCTIDLGGSRSVATEEGSTIWTPQGTGGHTLTHTAGDLTYTAQFAVLGDDVAVAEGRLSSSAVWAADKTHLVTAPLTVPSGVSLTIEPGAVVKFMPGASLTVASGGSCTAKGVIFTHVNDDTVGGDTLYDGEGAFPKMGDYTITGNITDDDTTEYRYMPPQTLTSSISSNTCLRGYRTYIVSNSVTVASGVTLTLQPGTILKFNTGCSLTVNGTLDAQGARAAPIVFTSLKDDAHGGDTNGDGEKTYAQAGDWHQITGSGTVKLNYCEVLWCSAQNNQGALYPNGGTWQFDNSIVAHCEYDCMRSYGGTFTANNSVFMDASMGAAPSSGTARFNNCVFNYLTTAVRWGNGTFYNCVFSDISQDIIDTKFYSSTLSSKFYNCCFWNPKSSGDHASAKVGQNGCFYADPLFVDAANGDFRIAANSPCVDAGDGSVAPELDWWGQPRMDVKRVKDTGVPNGDGVCPDIGIYEVPGAANVPLPDLAVVGGPTAVSATAGTGGPDGAGPSLAPGDALTVTYVVTNRGAAAVSGLVRDLFRFKGADAATTGLTVDAAEIEQAYNVPTGGCVTLTATITVPMLKAGKWKMMVNVGRAPYETMIANNSAEADEVITVTVEPFAVGESKTVEIPAGGVAGAAVAGLPAGGGAIVAALPKGVVFYASAGYVPDETQHDAEGVLLADGRTALFIPAHEEGEMVYVTLANDSGTVQTVTLAALESGDGLEVAKPADVAVTAKGPNVAAKLVLPESVRDGRVYAAWVEYSNSGDEDAELPIFTVSRTGGGATLSATANGTYSANPLSLVGLAPSAPCGKLKPGEAGRVAFYFMSSGNLSLKLGMVTEKSTSVLNGFATVAEYRAGMSAAATRLCARGGAEPGFTEVLAQALNEKRGAGGAAVCGTLRHSATKMPMAGVEVHLVLTNDSSVVDAVLTDANGHFTLTADDAGDYAVDVRDVFSLTPCIVSLAVGEDTPVSLSAVPLSSVSGVVEYSGTAEIAVGATVVLDDLSTVEVEDRVAETDESGMYSFGGLADGEYRLSLYPFEGYALVESDAFSVSNGVPVSRNLSYGAKGRVVFGVVADVETGAVVSNAVVMLSRGGASLGVTTDGDGRFKFDGIAAGRWGLTLEASAHQVDGLSEIVVEDGAGEQRIDIPARAKCPFAVLRPVGMVPHKATFSVLREGVTSLEWDFDGDGVADSTSETPEWTYSAVGTYSVALSYTDGDGVRRRSQWTDAVKVVAPFENVLKPNGALVSEADGVAVESVSETELVLSGSPVSAWASPGTVLGAETSSKGGFIRRVVSSENLGGGRWRFMVEKAGLADLYEQYFMSGDIALSAAKARKLMAARLASASRSGSGEEVSHGAKVVVPEREADNSFTLPTLSYTPLFSDASASITGSFEAWNGDAVKGSYGALVSEGRVLMTWYSATDTYKATVTASASYTKDWTKGLTGKEPFSKTWNQSWADIPIGWGFSLSLQTDEDLKFSIEGSGTVTVEQSFMARRTQMFFFDEDGELDSSTTTDWGATTSTKRSITGSISPTLDASLTLGLYGSFAKFVGRAGGGPKVGAKLSVTQSLGVGVENSFSAGSSGVDFDMAPIVESKLELGFTPYVGVNVSWKWLNIPKAKKYDVDLPLKMEWPNTASVGKMGISTAGDGLTVTFTAQNPKIEATGWIFKDLLGLDGVEVPADKFLWGLGDGSLLQEGRTVTHTYAKEGRYKIRLFGESPIPATLITYTGSPFVRTSVKWIEVFDDKPPEPQDTADTGSKSPKQSCDPNEMDGPDGVGEERYVKPGEWMTYTVYFENKSDADVPAQEVRVSNPLSEWLDWSTFEMCEVAFNNQVETGLAGKQNGTITVEQSDTAYRVQATVALDAENGVVDWYLRSVDPARADFNYWPPDGEGLLPPNDATHRGEGHLTYRIKVRDDAPGNVVITNSASIVFDYNDPIETDPAWWNTVTPVDQFLKAGEYVKLSLAELGYDVPTDGKTAYSVVAKGLPAGLQLKYNAAVTKKVKEKGKTKTVVVKPAKVEWWIEGVPTAALDFFTNPPYLVITVNGKTTVEALPLEVLAQEVVDLGELALGQSININGWLSGVGAGWTVSGLPTGLSFATKKVTKKVKSGKKTVTQTVAEAYAVYGKTTKAGLFTITAKKKKGTYYETKKFRVLVTPKAVDVATFGEELTNITTMAHVPVSWKLAGGDSVDGNGDVPALPVVPTVAKVTGLPTGLTFAAANVYGYKDAKKKTGKYVKQYGQTIVGTPTKPGTYVVTFTRNVTTGTGKNKKTVAKTSQILWKIVQNDAKLELGFNTSGGVVEGGVVGLNYGDLMAFTATSNATVTASGMPEGIKLSNLGNGQYAFTGFTTKAGTYLVTVKATLMGKTVTQRLALKVEGLPAWAKGTYNGNVKRKTGDGELGDEFFGLATVTVSAAGKISGKFYDGGTNWTLSAASYTERADDAFFCTNVVAKYAYKVTKKVKEKGKTVTKTETKYVMRRFSLEVGNEEPWDGVRRGYAVAAEQTGEDDADGVTLLAWQNLWGSTYKDVGKALFSTKSGKTTLAYRTFTVKGTTDEGAELGLDERMTLALKVTTAGAVTATMTFDTGKTVTDKKTKKKTKVYYKPTCQAVVIPATAPDSEEFEGEVYLFFAPSAANNFPGYVATIPL